MTKEEALQQLEYVLKLRNLSDHTITMYLFFSRRFIDFTQKAEMNDLALRDIQDYTMMMIEHGDNPKSINVVICAIRYLYESVLNKVYTRRQFPNLRYTHQDPFVFSKEMIQDLLNTPDCRMRLIILLGVDCGFRAAEVAHLRISDIDSKNNLITIHQSKRNKTRVVKLSQACLDVLRKYWLLYRPTDYFFPGKKENSHIATATVNNWFNQYIKKFSFYNKSIHYHSLRHTFATNMLENGCDIFLLKKLLGHDSLQSTAKYIHMQVSDIETAFSLSDVWGLQ